MAQLDRLLTQVITRAGSRLELKADRKPRLDLKSGDSIDLLPNPLPAVMVEVLAGDVVPPALKEGWLRDGLAEFEYDLAGQCFKIRLSRYMEAPQILAEHQGPSHTPILLTQVQPKVPAPVAAAPPPLPVASLPVAPDPVVPLREPIALEVPRPVPAEPRKQAPRINKAQGHPLAERLFASLLEKQGSDLHCTTHEPPIVRVHGDMKELEGFGILDPATLLEMMEAVATPAAWRKFEDHHDADFAYAYEAGGCRLRVNYFHDRVGPGFVCRVIPNQLPDPDKLGLPEPVRRLATLSKGLVLSRAPRAAASPPPSQPSSTWPTRNERTTSSPSRIPSSSCTPARAAW
jgi:twitching motility protein PilT